MLANTGIVRVKVEAEAIKVAVSKVSEQINLSLVSESVKTRSQHDKKVAREVLSLFSLGTPRLLNISNSSRLQQIS